MKSQREENNYEGWDWSELCSLFNVPDRIAPDKHYYKNPSLSEAPLADSSYLYFFLKEVLKDRGNRWKLDPKTKRYEYHYSRVMVFTANEIKKYIERLSVCSEGISHEASFWEGLYKIKNPHTLIYYFSRVCGSAWC